MTYTSHMTSSSIPVSISWLKAHLSEVLLKVRNGAKFTVLDRKTPIAELTMIKSGDIEPEPAIQYSYIAKGPFKMPKISPKKLPANFDIVELLLEDRRRR